MTGIIPSAGARRAITVSVMLAAMMNSLDTTIANVALPHIQGSVAASADEISWVLTSYIVAAAIVTPLTGWLADRLGRKTVLVWSIIGFTAASGLCGLATNLQEIVLFRLLQGVFGASLQPMSQATMLDMAPPGEQAQAMGLWSMAALLGPILGPTVGGWLTESFTWRWVFFINLPFGIIAALGVSAFMTSQPQAEPRPFDLFGFGMLGLAVACLQLLLDRGQTQDWFSSTEICIYAGGILFFGYLFVVHILTAERPFLDVALFENRNYILGCLIGFLLVIMLFGTLALIPSMLERLMGYPVVLTGIVTAPRGIGSMITMGTSGYTLKRFDPRLVMTVGFLLAAFSLFQMSGLSLGMDARLLVISGFLQGMGSGMIFVSLSLLSFGTLSSKLRNQGTAMFTLVRNVGAAAGISILQILSVRASASVHSRLVENIRPDNPVLGRAVPGFDFHNPVAVAAMNGQIDRQAAMVSYVDVYWLLFIVTLMGMPLVLLLRAPRTAMTPDQQIHME
ncbi:DHA2 family efflux MFS transporter permease subunit [Sphingomonas sp. CGMCC 1.13654]|uniref:DHA2 family efflux MFS transporter permease subunit n=1 Tax=Sphingomonas chungangi TaxID=2683589 RepID=A0A838L261_9SPHN|nr:DHA2 family efflux MFS transporter permease subunit [Sphingomonas chungangi]MBA2932612.1 DHA2 family efflux MFS transporter permease subunit [Sphingomonas chungangi]MVW56235.1 DHA2 family efflux MFS transporter permease subunit [Sphingomonas chungangi]